MTDTLTELKRLRDEATQGPWFQWPYMHGGTVCAQAPTEGDDPLTLADCDMDTRVDYDKQSCTNAALIVAAVNALPKLLACIDEAAFLVERLTAFGNDGDTKTDEGERDWHGHVAPPLSRLSAALASLKGGA